MNFPKSQYSAAAETHQAPVAAKHVARGSPTDGEQTQSAPFSAGRVVRVPGLGWLPLK